MQTRSSNVGAPGWSGLLLLALVFLAGCASSHVSEYRSPQGTIPRPDRILVYDFAATPAELPPEVAIAGQGAVSRPLTGTQLATGRKLGVEIARNLVADLRTMGLPAVRATGQSSPRAGDALVVGYLVVLEEGSAAERVGIGFGAGAAELKTVAKGYRMTDRGLKPLGSGVVEAGSGQLPGGAVPLAVTVVTGNPIGLAVSGAAKAYGEVSGSETIEGAARRTAGEIADKIRATAERQGWI